MPERLNIQGNVRYFPIGTEDNNQAISLLTVEPAPGGKNLTAFIQVSNFAAAPVARRLTVYADGALVNAYDLELAGKGQQAVLVENLPVTTTRTVEARLDGADLLVQDDRAWAVYRETEPASLLLAAADENYYHFLNTSPAMRNKPCVPLPPCCSPPRP
mgnify:CR=1 FL=1